MSLKAAAGGPAEEAEAKVERTGPIRVRTDSSTVQDFQSASGSTPVSEIVPLVFSIRWLALPEVRASLVDGVGGRDLLPIHESQSFTTTRRLDLDRDYLFSVELTHTLGPERLTLYGTVTTLEGDVCVRFETVLRLIGLNGGGVEAPE